MDVDARMQVFDLKTKYSFQTTPGVDQYNMPLYDVQIEPGNQNIASFPVYQGFVGPAYVNGVPIAFETEKNQFFSAYFNLVQNIYVVAQGDGTTGPYTIQIPFLPYNQQPLNGPYQGLLRGHVDITGILATGENQDPPLVSNAEIAAQDNFIQEIPVTSVDSKVYFTSIGADGSNVILSDSGQFLEDNVNYGLLMQPGKAPNGNLPLVNGPAPFYSTTQNTINYFTGVATNVYFPVAIPAGQNINVQGYFFQTGMPRSVLYYNNVLTFRAPPAQQYLVELQAYLSPAAFLNTAAAIPFAYMAEYIARGAARKILSDTGDVEQFLFYEPLFKEQELLVWKRSQRQWTSTRTETLFSYSNNQLNGNTYGNGGNI